jgi:hypothetical protein
MRGFVVVKYITSEEVAKVLQCHKFYKPVLSYYKPVRIKNHKFCRHGSGVAKAVPHILQTKDLHPAQGCTPVRLYCWRHFKRFAED